MKKITTAFLVISMAFALAACGAKGQTVDATHSTTISTDSVDLTVLSSTMVYAEVYNMMSDPERYKGRTVTMQGQFAVYEGETRNYYACLIADATSCCAQGIEFVLDGDFSYPEDYPEVGSTITVTGVFDIYAENGATYCQLIDATMK